MAITAITIKPTVGGMAFGVVSGGLCTAVGVWWVISGAILGIGLLVLGAALVGQMVSSRATVSDDTLVVSNGFRRRTFIRSEIAVFDVPGSFIKGGNAITVIPRPVMPCASTRRGVRRHRSASSRRSAIG